MTSLIQTRQRRQRARPRGNVQVRRALDSEPRLPHEHDESADSADHQTQDNQALAQQAAADVNRGLVDTDIGPPLRIAERRLAGVDAASPELDEATMRQPLPQDQSPRGKKS